MRLFDPTITLEGDEVCVAARVEVSNARNAFPETLWFRFAAIYADQVADRLDGFAVALLPLAMYLDEDLEVEGKLSARLLHGMREYQQVQATWQPSFFHRVEVSCSELSEAVGDPAARAVGSSFSAGVDSFHTLWRHLPQNERLPQFQVTHCLMINGFDADTDLDDQGHFSSIQKSIEPVMQELGIEFIVCRTNYMKFSDAKILKQSFGAMVVAPALVLGQLFSRFYIPASYRFDAMVRDGSHLMMDHLVSTESMQIIHDSAHLDRPQRTEAISDWPATWSTLRVCFNEMGFSEETGAVLNCGWCEKCVRTSRTLEILGRLDHFSVFARRPGHQETWRCYFGSRGAWIHGREVMKLAWEKGRFGIWFDYLVAMVLSGILKWPRDLMQVVHRYLEEHSEFYATGVRRLFPRLRRRAYWIKPRARRADPRRPTREPGRGQQ